MSRFQFDNAEQKRVRDLVLGPGFYGLHSREGRYVYVDKGRLATALQKRFAVDTIVQGRHGAAACIEEKIVRGEYPALTLETMSCTVPGRESDGWMRYGQADYLLWAMCRDDGNIMVHLFDFPKLQAAFWPAENEFPTTKTKQHNATLCRKVPIAWIDRQGVDHYRRFVRSTPEGKAAVKAFLESHYMRPQPAEPQ